MKLIKIYLLISMFLVSVYAGNPYNDLREDSVKLDNGRKNNPTLNQADKTNLIVDIDQIVSGNKYGINTNKLLTIDQKTLVKTSILTSWFADPLRDLNITFYQKILMPDNDNYYRHLSALFVLNWASQFAANNRGVLFYGQDKLVSKFGTELNDYLSINKNKFDSKFFSYFKNIKNLNTFVDNILGEEFIDLVFGLTKGYRDVYQEWAACAYEQCKKSNFFNNGCNKNDLIDENIIIPCTINNIFCEYGILIPKYPKEIVLNLFDMFKIEKEYYFEFDDRLVILAPNINEAMCKILEQTDKIIDEFSNNLINNLVTFNNISSIKSNLSFKGNWTESFRLKDGQLAWHYPNYIMIGNCKMSGRGKAVFSQNIIGNVYIPGTLSINADMTREEFIEALKKAGIY